MHKDSLLTKENWSLYRKGYLDQERHLEKVREAVKNNLTRVITEESIIFGGGKGIIRIPVHSLEEYHFRYRHREQGVGQGGGDTPKGTVIGRDYPLHPGYGPGAGDGPGVDYYEVEVFLEEIEALLFQELELPELARKEEGVVDTTSGEFKDVRKRGLMGNLDRKRTLMANIKRNALEGKRGIGNLTGEDLRFRIWDEKTEFETGAVVLAMMDTSGSMGTYEKQMARSFYYWMLRFLRNRYPQVDVIFIAHHAVARETSEEEFFTKSESGGTRCSTAYLLALDIIRERYPPSGYNVYAFHFTDGDNLPGDNEACVEAVKLLLRKVNRFGYGEIVNPYYRPCTLLHKLNSIKDRRLFTVELRNKEDVYNALRRFFTKQE